MCPTWLHALNEQNAVDGGEPLWQWHIHWSPESKCSSHGADAQVVVKVDVLKAGGLSPPLQLKAPCRQAHMLVNLPSDNVFHAMYEIQSANGSALTAPGVVMQDVHCPRDVYF